jgi:hypothetical protein
MMLAPTMKVLFGVITAPAMVLLSPLDSNSAVFISCLIGMQLFGLLWVMLHQFVVSERPWDKYLSSLHISSFHKMIVDVVMLLVFDAIIWVPIIFVYVLQLFQGHTSKVGMVVLLCQSIVLIESVVLAQVSFLKCRVSVLYYILVIDFIIIVVSQTINPILQLIVSISLISILSILALKCYKVLNKNDGILKVIKIKDKNYSYNSPSLFRLLLLGQLENTSKLSMIFIPPIITIFTAVAMLPHASDIAGFPVIISMFMLVNTLSISNLFKRMHMSWEAYSGYTNSLPISKVSLFCACLLVCMSFVLVCNAAIFVAAGFYVDGHVFIKLFVGFLLSLIYLIAAYLPQVEARRYGLLMSFILMFLFAYADYILINLLGK